MPCAAREGEPARDGRGAEQQKRQAETPRTPITAFAHGRLGPPPLAASQTHKHITAVHLASCKCC
jgi:hypothetical protein